MSNQKPRTPKPVRSYHLIALVLLIAFVAQCSWFIASVPLNQLEYDQIVRGVSLLRNVPVATAAVSSPLVPLASVIGISYHLPQTPFLLDQFWLDQHRWFIRIPFLFAGFCLALSLWYVARRLYGNAAGHIALALFAFSPGMVARSSLAGPEIFAAWGAFGLIFTAIATAHTLYAPRPVILWNWKRIALLGISITFAIGAQWPLAWLLIPAAAFMLWAVPHRRGAALLILGAGIAVSFVLLCVSYLFHFGQFFYGLRTATFISFVSQDLSLLRPRAIFNLLGHFYFNSVPASLLLFAIVLGAWFSSRRIRFFSNTAPLIVIVLLLGLAILLPLNGAGVILFAGLPFVLLFISGVFADLIESRLQAPALAIIFAFAAAQAAYSLGSLIRMYSRLPGS